MTSRILLFCAAAALATPAIAAPSYITPSLVAENMRPAAGRTTHIAVHFAPRPGWHVYWKNPGDAGMPPEASWELPSGAKVGELRHPAPGAISSVGLTSYVHEGPVALVSDLRVPGTLSPGDALPIVANLSWVSCSENMCVPEKATVRLDLVVGTGQGPTNPAFAGFLDALPPRLSTAGAMRAKDGKIEFAFVAPALSADAVRLYPEGDTFSASAPQEVRKVGGTLIFTLPFKGAVPSRFAGVISTGEGRGFEVRARPGAKPVSLAPPVSAIPAAATIAASHPRPSADKRAIGRVAVHQSQPVAASQPTILAAATDRLPLAAKQALMWIAALMGIAIVLRARRGNRHAS